MSVYYKYDELSKLPVQARMANPKSSHFGVRIGEFAELKVVDENGVVVARLHADQHMIYPKGAKVGVLVRPGQEDGNGLTIAELEQVLENATKLKDLLKVRSS
jgi:hypothetical protein